MVPRSKLVNKLRELGYTHARQAPRVDLWRKKGEGGTLRVEVPRRDQLSEEYVCQVLVRCGLSMEQAKSFCGQARS